MDFSHLFFYVIVWSILFSLCIVLSVVSSFFSVVAWDKFCPLLSKAGLISVRSNVFVLPRTGFCFVWNNHSHWHAPYFQKYSNSIASSKSGMCKLSQNLRCRRAEEHLSQVKKCDYFHGYQKLLIAIIGSYSGRSS